MRGSKKGSTVAQTSLRPVKEKEHWSLRCGSLDVASCYNRTLRQSSKHVSRETSTALYRPLYSATRASGTALNTRSQSCTWLLRSRLELLLRLLMPWLVRRLVRWLMRQRRRRRRRRRLLQELELLRLLQLQLIDLRQIKLTKKAVLLHRLFCCLTHG